MPYKHTQIGYTVLGVMAVAISIAFAVKAFIIAFMLFGATLLFSTLTVFVDAENASLWFGPGFLKKQISVIDIESCRAARHRYWFWGIWGWPGKMLFFRVGGPHFVEIKMRAGMRYCIGTDQPVELEKAIHEAMREAVHLATKVD